MMVEAIGQVGSTVYGITWTRRVEAPSPASPPVEPIKAVESGSVAEEAWLEALASMVRGGAVVILNPLDRSLSDSQVIEAGLRRRLDRVYRAESSEQGRWQRSGLAGQRTRPSRTHSVRSADGSPASEFHRIVSTLEQTVDRHVGLTDEAQPETAARLRSLADRLRDSLYQAAQQVEMQEAGSHTIIDRIEERLEQELAQLQATQQDPSEPSSQADETPLLETLRQAFAIELHHLRQSLVLGQTRPAQGAVRTNRSADRAPLYPGSTDADEMSGTGRILNAVA